MNLKMVSGPARPRESERTQQAKKRERKWERERDLIQQRVWESMQTRQLNVPEMFFWFSFTSVLSSAYHYHNYLSRCNIVKTCRQVCLPSHQLNRWSGKTEMGEGGRKSTRTCNKLFPPPTLCQTDSSRTSKRASSVSICPPRASARPNLISYGSS